MGDIGDVMALMHLVASQAQAPSRSKRPSRQPALPSSGQMGMPSQPQGMTGMPSQPQGMPAMPSRPIEPPPPDNLNETMPYQYRPHPLPPDIPPDSPAQPIPNAQPFNHELRDWIDSMKKNYGQNI